MQIKSPIQHIAGYQFIALTSLLELRAAFRKACESLNLIGTILLSEEGINMNLAGLIQDIHAFKTYLKQDERFAAISFHDTYCTASPYKRLKIKIKKEIITMRHPETDVARHERTPAITPMQLKQWLDKQQDFTLLDTRNDYEINYGTFSSAKHLHLSDFNQFPEKLSQVDKKKPVVIFCTGGIRCEKAGLYMQQHGFNEVYQLDGGILGYFAQVGGAHYHGECFVFDERIALDPQLQTSHLK